jgi:hypothetical protein
MMTRTHSQTRLKGKNGVGDSLTVYFDKTDPAERRALEAARLLALKHGRRKQLLVTLLEAVYLHYEQTGELISSAKLVSMLNAPMATGRSSEASPSAAFRSDSKRASEQVVSHTKSRVTFDAPATSSNADVIGANFAKSMRLFLD